MRPLTGILAALLLLASPGAAGAEEGTGKPEGVVVVVGTVDEDGRKMLLATVSKDGEPVEGALVAFFAERTFGLLGLGEEETLDDGTSAVPFPGDLPGGPTGTLRIVARVTAPEDLAGAEGRIAVGGAGVVPLVDDPFPRALWAPDAPVALIGAFVVLLGGVWLTYAWVLRQMLLIRRGGGS